MLFFIFVHVIWPDVVLYICTCNMTWCCSLYLYMLYDLMLHIFMCLECTNKILNLDKLLLITTPFIENNHLISILHKMQKSNIYLLPYYTSIKCAQYISKYGRKFKSMIFVYLSLIRRPNVRKIVLFFKFYWKKEKWYYCHYCTFWFG